MNPSPHSSSESKLSKYDTYQYRLLKRFYPRSTNMLTETPCESKLPLLGSHFPAKINGKSVIDFGCGKGAEAVAMVKLGAKKVVGIDIQEPHLQEAAERARAAGVADRCTFASATTEQADIIVSLDAFEHFGDPARILDQMHNLLRPGGSALVSFGPTWYHPLGGHLFSVFPWAHLVFSESALVRWRSDFKSDGATRFSEVTGGLNQITIRRFSRIAKASSFHIASLECVPIRSARFFHNRLTQEFVTALVRAELIKSAD